MALKTAIVAGSLVLDITMVMNGDRPVRAEDLFRQGKLTLIDEVRFYLGGCAGNTGLALHRLGTPVRLLSRVGEDDAGRMIAELLRQQGVPAGIRVDAPRGSACGIAITPPGMDKISFFRRGAAQYFEPSDVTAADLEGADLYHFGYPTAMPTMYGRLGAGLVEMLTRVKARGVTTSLDTSLPDLKSDAARVDWRSILKKALPLTDIFVPSLEELYLMLRQEAYRQAAGRAGQRDMMGVITPETAVSLAQECIDLGARIVLVKAGKQGLLLKTAQSTGLPGLSHWDGQALWRPPLKVDAIVSATGAGDTAIAGFLAALLRETAPERALQMASLAARRCITSADTVSRIEPFPDMERALAAQPPLIPTALPKGWEWDGANGVYRVV